MQKNAIVTGATRGIGLGIAQRLLREGWTVLGTGTGEESAYAATIADLRGLGSFQYQRCDISSAQDRKALTARAAAEFPRLDALVNNAGIAPAARKDMLDLGEEEYDAVMDVNLRGTFFLTQEIAKVMLEQSVCGEEKPIVITVSSISAYASSMNRAAYCLSKAGLAMMTQLFAERLSEHGIRVYEIRPGIIETDMTSGVHGKYDALIDGGLLPIARWGKPEDVADAVWAICSGLLAYSTGEVLNVDGGFHLRRL